MKMAIAFVLNFFLPGLGNVLVGRWVQGLIQLFLTLVAFVLIVTVFLTFFGLVIFGLAWLYALVVWFTLLGNKN